MPIPCCCHCYLLYRLKYGVSLLNLFSIPKTFYILFKQTGNYGFFLIKFLFKYMHYLEKH